MKKFIYQHTLVFLFICFYFTPLHARIINLYAEPRLASKIIGTVDKSKGIMSIYSPKGSEWVKVADPSNGNVGWIKSNELGNANVRMNIVSGKEGNESYQFIQFGNTKPMPPAEVDQAIKAMHEREGALAKSMEQMMQHFFADWTHPWFASPMILPVVMVPMEKAPIQSKQEALKKTKETQS